MAEPLLLIQLQGKDKPGIAQQITALLAESNAQILDIVQSAVLDHFTLNVLVELTLDASGLAQLQQTLQQKAQQLGIALTCQMITADEYDDWKESEGKSRHIVTLLASKITAEQMAAVTDVVCKHGLTIAWMDRLSGRVERGQVESTSRSCIELSLRGNLSSSQSIRSDFLALSSQYGIDIAYQQQTGFYKNRRVVVFDMDSTLIQAEVIDELAKRAGVGEQVIAITESAMRGEIDFNESFKRRIALLKGLPEAVLQEVAASLPITEGVPRLMATLKRFGYKTAILSGGFTYFAHYLQSLFGFDYVYANQLEIVDGQLTGNYLGGIVDGQRKAELVSEIADKERVDIQQVIAVGDGANDLPMLAKAGLGIAFHAKPLVRENAQQVLSNSNLDAVLYLMGFNDRDLQSISD